MVINTNRDIRFEQKVGHIDSKRYKSGTKCTEIISKKITVLSHLVIIFVAKSGIPVINCTVISWRPDEMK